jgi:DNA polymerase epsilon subunit 3
MPARKSTASAADVPPVQETQGQAEVDNDQASSSDEGDYGLGVEDFNLPRTMVQRLAKGVLPANTQIQKDALLAISKSATVFVNYIASHANDNTFRHGKKTIQTPDVLEALRDTEFEQFIERVQDEHASMCSKAMFLKKE